MWNEKLDKIPLDPHGSTILRLEVFDHDLIGDDDSLGYFEINSGNFSFTDLICPSSIKEIYISILFQKAIKTNL